MDTDPRILVPASPFDLDYELRLLHAQLTAFVHENQNIIAGLADDHEARVLKTHNGFVIAMANRVGDIIAGKPFVDPNMPQGVENAH